MTIDRWGIPLAVVLATVLGCGMAVADDLQMPLYVMGGISRRTNGEVGGTGLYGALGYVSGAAGVFQSGSAGVDLQVRHNQRDTVRLDSYEVLYSERVFGLLGDVYLGYAVGTGFDRLSVSGPHGGVTQGWRLTGKVMAGYSVANGVVAEGAYVVAGSVGGVNTSGVVAAVGLWF